MSSLNVPAFIALVSFNTDEPFYILKVLTKGKTEKKLGDQFGHTILPGEYYLNGVYLQKARSRDQKKKKFTILDFEVYVSPDEVFEPFVEVDGDLCIHIDTYHELSERVSLEM